MSSSSGDQLEIPGTAVLPRSPSERGLLGIALDQQAFLGFLNAEWLFPPSGGALLLGVGQACTTHPSLGVGASIWFDSQSLPDTTVMAWRAREWRETKLRGLEPDDAFVAWTGPLPLFAVHHVEAASESALDELFVLARNFADMTVPELPTVLNDAKPSLAPAGAPLVSGALAPPENWNSVRGAAAMAAFALPAIDPWVDLFCQTLRKDGDLSEASKRLHAPWWRYRFGHASPTEARSFPPFGARSSTSLASPTGCESGDRKRSLSQSASGRVRWEKPKKGLTDSLRVRWISWTIEEPFRRWRLMVTRWR